MFVTITNLSGKKEVINIKLIERMWYVEKGTGQTGYTCISFYKGGQAQVALPLEEVLKDFTGILSQLDKKGIL